MDSVSLALITAISSGITGSITDTTKDILVAGYTALKDRLIAKFGHKHPDVTHALTELETHPDSQARQGVLIEELTNAQAIDDPELLPLAQKLLEQIQQSPQGAQVIQHVERSAVSQYGNATNYNIQGDQYNATK